VGVGGGWRKLGPRAWAETVGGVASLLRTPGLCVHIPGRLSMKRAGVSREGGKEVWGERMRDDNELGRFARRRGGCGGSLMGISRTWTQGGEGGGEGRESGGAEGATPPSGGGEREREPSPAPWAATRGLAPRLGGAKGAGAPEDHVVAVYVGPVPGADERPAVANHGAALPRQRVRRVRPRQLPPIVHAAFEPRAEVDEHIRSLPPHLHRIPLRLAGWY